MTTMALAVDHGAQRSRDGWRSEPHVYSSQTFCYQPPMRSERVSRGLIAVGRLG